MPGLLTTELIEQVLTTIPKKRIGLLGDLFLDRYLDIDPALDEPSVETGLMAYQVTGVRSYPGALGTVLNNLSALGVGRIYPIAAIGDDGEGYELRQALDRTRGYEPGGVILATDRRTPTYCKPMRGGVELNRLDIKNRTPTPPDIEDRILALLESAWPTLDALIVLDQVSEEDCGVVTDRVRERLAELGGSDPTKFVLADSRERIGLFKNVSIKPNTHEAAELAVWPRENGGAIFVTQGSEGIRYFPPNWNPDPFLRTGGAPCIPAFPVSGPIDVCGAGDSCSAGITSAIVAGLTHEQAASFGNLIASITVQQIGTTGTASPDQVRARWREVNC